MGFFKIKTLIFTVTVWHRWSPAYFCMPCHQPFSSNQPPRLTCSNSYSSSTINQVYLPQPHRFCQIALPILCKTLQHFSLGRFRAANHALVISIKLKLSSPFCFSVASCVSETLAALLCLLFCVRCVHINLLASTFTSLSLACLCLVL